MVWLQFADGWSILLALSSLWSVVSREGHNLWPQLDAYSGRGGGAPLPAILQSCCCLDNIDCRGEGKQPYVFQTDPKHRKYLTSSSALITQARTEKLGTVLILLRALQHLSDVNNTYVMESQWPQADSPPFDPYRIQINKSKWMILMGLAPL